MGRHRGPASRGVAPAGRFRQATARQLKREEMVKLPVVVYRRPDKRTTIADAVTLQRRLEKIAAEDERPAIRSQG